jgi:signal transduction histidine kinase
VRVEEGGVTLGAIDVSITHGRPFRATDEHLLQAIADQAAVAFHNLAMEAQLQDHVAALDRTTKELSGSRARIFEAGDAARRSLAAGISREVLPDLRAVSDELELSVDRRSPQRIDDMVTGVNAALESLRELTHGVFPAQLARSGLEPALRSYLRGRGLRSLLVIQPDVLGKRFPPRVEAAVFFAATRAVGTGRGPGSLLIGVDEGDLSCTVSDAEPAVMELVSITDRVESVGGSLRFSDGSLELRIPLAAATQPAVLPHLL